MFSPCWNYISQDNWDLSLLYFEGCLLMSYQLISYSSASLWERNHHPTLLLEHMVILHAHCCKNLETKLSVQSPSPENWPDLNAQRPLEREKLIRYPVNPNRFSLVHQVKYIIRGEQEALVNVLAPLKRLLGKEAIVIESKSQKAQTVEKTAWAALKHTKVMRSFWRIKQRE